MYQTTRRHISEGRYTGSDIDIHTDTRSLRNQTKNESLLHVIATHTSKDQILPAALKPSRGLCGTRNL